MFMAVNQRFCTGDWDAALQQLTYFSSFILLRKGVAKNLFFSCLMRRETRKALMKGSALSWWWCLFNRL
jgi:hypothetical protein